MGWESIAIIIIIIIPYSYQSLTTKLTVHVKETRAEMDKHNYIGKRISIIYYAFKVTTFCMAFIALYR